MEINNTLQSSSYGFKINDFLQVILIDGIRSLCFKGL
jgi:hypothetical protein